MAQASNDRSNKPKTEANEEKTTASDILIEGFGGMVNEQDISAVMETQNQLISRFDQTNQSLTSINALSEQKLQQATALFAYNTQALVSMKKDLDYIFKKIRFLKEKVGQRYPKEFAASHALRPRIEEELEEEEEGGERREVTGGAEGSDVQTGRLVKSATVDGVMSAYQKNRSKSEPPLLRTLTIDEEDGPETRPERAKSDPESPMGIVKHYFTNTSNLFKDARAEISRLSSSGRGLVDGLLSSEPKTQEKPAEKPVEKPAENPPENLPGEAQ